MNRKWPRHTQWRHSLMEMRDRYRQPQEETPCMAPLLADTKPLQLPKATPNHLVSLFLGIRNTTRSIRGKKARFAISKLVKIIGPLIPTLTKCRVRSITANRASIVTPWARYKEISSRLLPQFISLLRANHIKVVPRKTDICPPMTTTNPQLST